MASRRSRVTGTLPVVEPILLTPRRDPFNDPAWLFEPKYDGYRGLLYVTRKDCHFRSKRGNVLRRFEELCHWVRDELPVKSDLGRRGRGARQRRTSELP
jgi:ATP-dependent DNA ligase